ncbi:uncharacterized protein LOC117302625 [Asterias rubens]|uniref:uncharacterized protein LOC117302625 n=1 Tax=Asterias rubens TaxID=7604 RepID=UPI001455445C|nr:uncharacterized protein LOC117302625 [Asterias rubens]
MTTALWIFLLLILIRRPGLVSSQNTTGPTATVHILPEYTTEPREGDSVTLDCEISSLQRPDEVRWTRKTNGSETIIVKGNATFTNAGKRISVSPLKVVSTGLYVCSHKITISPLRRPDDQGFYTCEVNVSSNTITSSEMYLHVHSRNEFPVCLPGGPATVAIGSSLSCNTLSDTRMSSVSEMGMTTEANGWIISPTNAEGSPGQELTRTVANSDHGKTFHCFSISNASAMALACTIGPLTVYTKNTGLSGADIAGIVIGAILLLVIIAVHTLCCRCNPKRWLYAKSYTFNVGSSFASTLERDNAILTQPDAELRNVELENDNFGVLASAVDGIDDAICGSDTEDAGQGCDHEPEVTAFSTSEQPYPMSTDPKPTPPTMYATVHQATPVTDTKKQIEPNLTAVYATVNKTTQVIDSKEPIEPKPPAIYAHVNKTSPVTGTKEPAKPNFSAVYANVNETTPVTNSKEPTELKPPAIYAPVNKPTPETESKELTGLKSPGIYAQVNKPTPITDTSEPITHQPNPSVNNTEIDKNASQDDKELLKENGKDSSNLKNIKRFGQNRNGKVSRPPHQEPVLIYADLDLKEPVNDEVHPPSDDSQTVYAQIKY